MTKAEQDAREAQNAFEKQQAKDGVAIHLARAGEPGSPGYVAPKSASASKKKKAAPPDAPHAQT